MTSETYAATPKIVWMNVVPNGSPYCNTTLLRGFTLGGAIDLQDGDGTSQTREATCLTLGHPGGL